MRKLDWFLVLVALASCTKPTAPDGILLTGSWGSAQGFLAATQVSTQFTGACGSGNTNRPLMLDRHGRFDIVGVYGATGQTKTAAHFMGTVGDQTLTLRVMMADSTEAVRPIVLNLGQRASLAACQ